MVWFHNFLRRAPIWHSSARPFHLLAGCQAKLPLSYRHKCAWEGTCRDILKFCSLRKQEVREQILRGGRTEGGVLWETWAVIPKWLQWGQNGITRAISTRASPSEHNVKSRFSTHLHGTVMTGTMCPRGSHWVKSIFLTRHCPTPCRWKEYAADLDREGLSEHGSERHR